jgi:predicted nucleic acid-binding protein
LTRTLVVDTGVLFAALDADDDAHHRCAALLASDVVSTIPAPVVVELDWLARTRRVPEAMPHLLGDILGGSVLVANLDCEDYERVLELIVQYGDMRLSLADASVVAIAERLEQDTIATLDRRHFSVVRPLHVESFTLVP